MDIRNISPDDWDTLIKWGVNKDKDLLPKDGTGGLLVHLENMPIVAFEQSLKELGFKSIVVIGRDEMLDNSYKALGWKEDEKINKLIKNI